MNADGNMPYDLCDDVATLNYIESEMARQGRLCRHRLTFTFASWCLSLLVLAGMLKRPELDEAEDNSHEA